MIVMIIAKTIESKTPCLAVSLLLAGGARCSPTVRLPSQYLYVSLTLTNLARLIKTLIIL